MKFQCAYVFNQASLLIDTLSNPQTGLLELELESGACALPQPIDTNFGQSFGKDALLFAQ